MYTLPLSVVSSISSPCCFSNAPWLWDEQSIPLCSGSLFSPVGWLPFHPHLGENHPPEITWQSCVYAHTCTRARTFLRRPYGLPTPKQFPVPYVIDILCYRGWKAKIFNFPTYPVLTNEKGNILSRIKSKASLGENPLPFILSHYSYLEYRHKAQVYSSNSANVKLQAWEGRPRLAVERKKVGNRVSLWRDPWTSSHCPPPDIFYMIRTEHTHRNQKKR